MRSVCAGTAAKAGLSLDGGGSGARIIAFELDAFAIGDVGAPPRGSPDEDNIRWCAEQDRMLVTNDRGKKDRVIHALLAQHQVDALFVYNDLRALPLHHLLRAILAAEAAIGQSGTQRGVLSGRLTRSGRVERRRG